MRAARTIRTRLAIRAAAAPGRRVRAAGGALFALLMLGAGRPATVRPGGQEERPRAAHSAADCGSLNSLVGGWVGIYGDSTATVTCPAIAAYDTTTWWIVATLAGGSSCGITGAEFRLAGAITSPPNGLLLTWHPDSRLTSSVGDPLDLDGAGGGVRVTLSCPPNAAAGQRIVLGTVKIESDESAASVFLTVRGHSNPADPGTPFANFTRCDGARVTMQRSTTAASAKAFIACGIYPPAIAYVTKPAARPTGTLAMDVVGPDTTLNAMTVIARLERAAQPAVYATSVTPVALGRIAVTFPVSGLALGPWDLHLTTDAGSATLARAVVFYDEAVTLDRITSHPTDIPIATNGVLAQYDSLAFTRSGGLYVTSLNGVDTGTTHRVAQGTAITSPAWSPGGDRIAINGLSGTTSFVQSLLRTTGAVVGSGVNGDAPAWSPLEERLALLQPDISDVNQAVFTVDLTTGTEAQVTLTGLGAAAPAWSPDGKRIAFRRGNQILIVSADRGESTGARVVTTLTNPQWGLSWSPDGRWIAYSDTRAGNSDIYVCGSRETQYGEYRITTSPGDDFNPVWSRDGNRLAFVSSRAGENNVYVASNLPFRPDADGDYVLDSADACPGDPPRPPGKTDRNFDGCVDAAAAFRSVRFWSADRLPFHYEIEPQADPAITDGSDIEALTNAVATWAQAAGFTPVRDTPSDIPSNAKVGDGRNTMTFVDPDPIRSGYLAVAIITSVAGGDTVIDGTWYRPGEIVDADILFNAAKYTFTTPSYPGLGQSDQFDLQSIATHEFGHVLGLAHSSVPTASMYWAIPHDTSFRSLAPDDRTLLARVYGAPAANASGRILRADGVTPIPGAAVLAMGTASGDTLQMTLAGVDGAYSIRGVAESFRIFVQPVDGGPEVGGLSPPAVGVEFAGVAATDFTSEYWDGASETPSDTGTGTIVAVPGPAVTNADVIINSDVTGPLAIEFTPPDGASGIPVTTTVAIKFNDRIDQASLAGSIALRKNGVTAVSGAAGLLQRDSLVVFVPTAALEYSASYTLSVSTGIRDRSGNALQSAASATFTTQAQPALSLVSVSPHDVLRGGVVVLEGTGFSPTAAQNSVQFTGAGTVIPTAATPVRLYVTVPSAAMSGNVTVTTNAVTSNAVLVTVVASRSAPTVTPVGNVSVLGTVTSLAVTADGGWAYVGTTTSLAAVDADPASGGFLTVTPFSIPGGCTAVTALGDGRHAVAVGPTQPRFRIVETDLVNRTHSLVAVANLVSVPLGVAPLTGGDVLVAFADRVVRLSTAVGVNPGQEVRAWSDPTLTFQGGLAVAPDGLTAYATAADGRVAILGLAAGQGVLHIGLGSTAPREIAAPPAGTRFLAVDDRGMVRIGDVNGNTVIEQQFQAWYRALAISPEGELAYAADFLENQIEILNIQGNTPTLLGTFATARDPVDVATGQAGRYVYVVAAGRLWVYDTFAGPRITSVFPDRGGPGTRITIVGTGFSSTPVQNVVTIGGVAHTPVSATSVPPMSGNTRLVVVQGNVPSGPLTVTVDGVQSPEEPYAVVNVPTTGLALGNLAAGRFTGTTVGRVLVSPHGDRMLLREAAGTLTLLDLDPQSPKFHRTVQVVSAAQSHLVSPDGAMLMAPDGSKVYAVDPGASRIRIYTATPGAITYLSNVRVTTVDENIPSPTDAVLSPDGMVLFVRVVSAGMPQVWAFYTVTNLRLGVFSLSSTAYTGLAIHPDGSLLYIMDSAGARVMRADPFVPGFGTNVATLPIGTAVPHQAVIDPEGSRLIVLGITGAGDWVNVVDIDPASPTYGTVRQQQQITVAPVAQSYMVLNASGEVLHVARPGVSPTVYSLRSFNGLFALENTSRTIGASPVNVALSADDKRLYYGGALTLFVTFLGGGVNATRASDLTLIAPRSALVRDPFAVRTAPGMPVAFLGRFLQFTYPIPFAMDTTWAIADVNGFARTPTYICASSPSVTTVPGVTPYNTIPFQVTVVDSNAAPQFVAVSPRSTDSPGTDCTVVVDFSRSIRPSTITVAGLSLRSAGQVVPVDYTLLNNSRRILMRPQAALSPGTAYSVQYDAALQDGNGTALANPGSQSFTTSSAQLAMVVRAISPPAARVGYPIVVSGVGFGSDLDAVRVRFGAASIRPSGGDGSTLYVSVPEGATSGPVFVVAGSDSTAGPDFAVLERGEEPRDDVIGTIPAPSSGHAIVIVPDGTRSYMTCPGAGTVVPFVIETRVAEPAIPVGVQPFGIACSPGGDRVYVTNYLSNEVSIIGAAAGPTFQQVTGRVPVRGNPTGIAVHPDGRRIYVACYTDGAIRMVNTDAASPDYLRVLSETAVGSRTQTVAITPDGERLVVGTASGILLLDADNPGDGTARVPVGTGTASQAIVISGDGGFAVVLSSDGNIILIDLSRRAEIARVPVGTGTASQAIVISGDGGTIHVSDANNNTLAVFRISEIVGGGGGGGSPRRYTLTGLTPLPSVAVGENPIGMAVDPVSGRLLVVNAGDPSVSIVDGTYTPVADAAPLRFGLEHPRPNPFRGQTSLLLELPSSEPVELHVYSVDGRLVRTVIAKRLPAGRHVITWDGRNSAGAPAASGVYLVRVRAGRWSDTRKAVLLR